MVESQQAQVFPELIPVTPDPKEERSFHIDADQQLFTTDRTIVSAFETINETYESNREAKVTELFGSVSRLAIKGSYSKSAQFDVAHLTSDADVDSNELMLLTSPLNDGKPTSSVKRLLDYVKAVKPSFMQVSRAKPNSWSPITKLSIGHDLLSASGRPMPTAQILSPVSPRAMTFADRWKLARGDYTAYGKLAAATIDHVNTERLAAGKTPVTKVHFFGAGIAQRALGAARYINDERPDIEVASVHAMNLSLKRGPKTAIDHLQQRMVSDDAETIVPKTFIRVAEPTVRQEIDARSDSIRVIGRQLNAFRHVFATIVPLMFAYKQTVNDIGSLIESKIPTRLSMARNVAMGSNTLGLLAKYTDQLMLTDIAPVADEQAGMMTNEHAGLVAVLMSLGPRDADQQPR